MNKTQIEAAKKLAERLESAENVLSTAKEYLKLNGMIRKDRDTERAIDKHFDTYHKEPVDETFEKWKVIYEEMINSRNFALQDLDNPDDMTNDEEIYYLKAKAIFQTTPKPTLSEIATKQRSEAIASKYEGSLRKLKDSPTGTQWSRFQKILKEWIVRGCPDEWLYKKAIELGLLAGEPHIDKVELLQSNVRNLRAEIKAKDKTIDRLAEENEAGDKELENLKFELKKERQVNRKLWNEFRDKNLAVDKETPKRSEFEQWKKFWRGNMGDKGNLMTESYSYEKAKAIFGDKLGEAIDRFKKFPDHQMYSLKGTVRILEEIRDRGVNDGH